MVSPHKRNANRTPYLDIATRILIKCFVALLMERKHHDEMRLSCLDSFFTHVRTPVYTVLGHRVFQTHGSILDDAVGTPDDWPCSLNAAVQWVPWLFVQSWNPQFSVLHLAILPEADRQHKVGLCGSMTILNYDSVTVRISARALFLEVRLSDSEVAWWDKHVCIRKT